MLLKNPLIIYFIRFFLCFCVLYYGTKAVIGITAPGGLYWGIADSYFNYVAGLRSALLHCSMWVLQVLGYDIYLKNGYTIKMQGGAGVHVVYSCLGYGVMSFWIAFVFANNAAFRQKLFWVTAGLLSIFLINVSRISVMLVAVNKKWKSPLGFDNHTWFNIAAYAAIFILIWLFDKNKKTNSAHS